MCLNVSFFLCQVLDNGLMFKLERKCLLEVPADLVGLLEPVSDPEARLKLLGNTSDTHHRFPARVWKKYTVSKYNLGHKQQVCDTLVK